MWIQECDFLKYVFALQWSTDYNRKKSNIYSTETLWLSQQESQGQITLYIFFHLFLWLPNPGMEVWFVWILYFFIRLIIKLIEGFPDDSRVFRHTAQNEVIS